MAIDPCSLNLHNYRIVTTSIVGGHILVQCQACKKVDDIWPVHLEGLQKKYQEFLNKEKSEAELRTLKKNLKEELIKENNTNPNIPKQSKLKNFFKNWLRKEK